MKGQDTSTLASAEARDFLLRFVLQREANRDFYRSVPAEKLDCRVVGAKGRPSDSPRDSLVHHLFVLRNYVYSVKAGVMRWGHEREQLLLQPAVATWDKRRLLAELERTDRELIALLSEPGVEFWTVRVGWQEAPLPALRLLRGLIDHEILQAGWNQALMARLQCTSLPSICQNR